QPSNPQVNSHTSVKYTVRIQIANRASRISRCFALTFAKISEKCISLSSSLSLSFPPPARAVRTRLPPQTVIRPLRHWRRPHPPKALSYQTPQTGQRVQFPLRKSQRPVPVPLRLQPV